MNARWTSSSREWIANNSASPPKVSAVTTQYAPNPVINRSMSLLSGVSFNRASSPGLGDEIRYVDRGQDAMAEFTCAMPQLTVTRAVFDLPRRVLSAVYREGTAR